MSQSDLPLHWKIVRLKDIALKNFGGGTPSTKNAEFWDGSIPWTTTAVINTDDVYLTRYQRCITKEGLQNSSSKVASKGCVLIGTRVGVGKAVVATFDIAINQDITVVVPDSSMLPEFLVLLFKTSALQVWLSDRKRGTTIKGIPRNDILAIPIPLPPLSKQRAIAHTLQTIQQAKEARQRELELEQERKAGLMQYLFTYGTCNESQKRAEIGAIPESWQVTKLGELCVNRLGSIQTGPFGSQLHAYEYQEIGIPVVNPTNLGINTIVEYNIPCISREKADILAKHYLIEGDILISRRGDFSRYSYISSKYSGWFCGTGCLLIRLNNPEVDNYFISVLISTEIVQNYLKQNSVGSIMPNLNTKILQSLPIILPRLPEQQEISTVLCACDTKISSLEREILLLNELFRLTLEELMTGRISVIPSVESEVAA